MPAGTAAAAGLFAAGLAAGFGVGLTADFGAGLAALFFNVLRAAAGGAAFFRAGTDAFDFAAVFFVFATALAMTYKLSAERGMDWAPYTILNGSAQGAMLGSGAYRCNQRNSPRPIRPLRIKKIATIKLSSRGMIRISTPAITEMIGEMWATVRVIRSFSDGA